MRIIVLSIFVVFAYTTHSLAKPTDDVTYPEEIDVDPCEGLTYCTVKPKNYPQEQLNNMFKDYTVFHRPSPQMELPSRMGESDIDDADQCKSEVKYESLYQVRLKRKDAWRIVVQVPEKNFLQKVRMETCVDKGGDCFTAFPKSNQYKAGCSQIHMNWQVLVYNEAKNDTERIYITVPSCCSCKYKTIF